MHSTHTFHHCFIVFATDRRVTPSHRLTYGNPVRTVDAKQPKCETHRHEGRLRSLSFRLGKRAGKIHARLGAHAIRGGARVRVFNPIFSLAEIRDS